MKIGVFDSGIGGEAMARAIRKELPEHELITVSDTKHVPYGTRAPAEIHHFVLPLLKQLQAEGCNVIVVACNTVCTTLITKLRQELSVPLVAMEPMVKPAAEQTKTGVIAVCATPTTLQSERYNWLKQTYAKNVKVLEPDCSQWAGLIEAKQIDRSHIHEQIDSVCQAGADVIVLGCTHYHWIEDIVKSEAAGRAMVIQPEKPVIEQLKRVLAQLA